MGWSGETIDYCNLQCIAEAPVGQEGKNLVLFDLFRFMLTYEVILPVRALYYVGIASLPLTSTCSPASSVSVA